MRRAAILLPILFLLPTILAPHAHAHSAQLESMQPPDGATISSPSTPVSLTYTAPVIVEDLRVELPDGRQAEPDSTTSGTVTSFELPAPREAGAATVRWAVPQSDGHVIEYDATFTYAESAVDPRVHEARIAIDDAVTAMWAALAAFS